MRIEFLKLLKKYQKKKREREKTFALEFLKT